MCKNLTFLCAVCRICFYSICNCLCCRRNDEQKPEFSVLCVGLSKSGKTTMICSLLNEDTSDIVPTNGFSFKDVVCEKAVLCMKELGGSDAVMPYWHKYYRNSQAVVYVIDPHCSESEKQLNASTFAQVMSHPTIRSLPVMVLALSKTDTLLDSDQIHEILHINGSQSQELPIFVCSHRLDDVVGVRQSFELFSQRLINQSKHNAASQNVVTNQI